MPKIRPIIKHRLLAISIALVSLLFLGNSLNPEDVSEVVGGQSTSKSVLFDFLLPVVLMILGGAIFKLVSDRFRSQGVSDDKPTDGQKQFLAKIPSTTGLPSIPRASLEAQLKRLAKRRAIFWVTFVFLVILIGFY